VDDFTGYLNFIIHPIIYSCQAPHWLKISWRSSPRRLPGPSRQHAEWIRLIDAFAQLIANTDRHFGNITLFDDYEGPFQLAPVYDTDAFRAAA
jgi:hypothetical protein